MTPAAVRALDDIELPFQYRLPYLRGAGHVDPGGDPRLEILAAVSALKCLFAVGVCPVFHNVRHVQYYSAPGEKNMLWKFFPLW